MKLTNLLVLSISSLLVLGGCNNGDDGHETGLNPSTGEDTSGETTGEGGKQAPYYLEGETVGFPREVVDTFLSYFGLDYYLPSMGSETLEWEYSVGVDSDCYSYVCVSCEDNGAIGTDSMEDAYKLEQENHGVTVSNDQYDLYGYTVCDEDGEIEYFFYSDSGLAGNYFLLYAYGPTFTYEEQGYVHTTSIPSEIITNYLKNTLKVDVTFPTLNIEGDFYSKEIEDEDYGACLTVLAIDDGTPGTDAFEDKVAAALANVEGWDVDDTYAEYYGYFATYGTEEFEIMFYTYDGFFTMNVYDNSESR